METYTIKNTKYRVAGASFIFFTALYLFWLANHLNPDAKIVSIPFFLAQLFTFLLLTLSIRNHWRIKYRVDRPKLTDNPPPVAIVITTFKEPIEIIKATLNSVLKLDYSAEKIIVIGNDDKNPNQIRKLSNLVLELGAGKVFLLNTIPHTDAKAGNLNQVVTFLRNKFPNIDLLLTQDADELVLPDLLNATVGYFTNPNVACVQTVKSAKVSRSDPFGNQDYMWYGRTAPSREADNAMFACGSGVIWRISSLESVGGFSTWNLVEDLTTSYNLLSRGWEIRYHYEVLSQGLAPEDLPNFIKQKVTWATDSLRIFFWDNPVFKQGLTFKQKLHFLETPLFYLNSFAVVTLILVTTFSLFTAKWPTTAGALTHLLYLLPSFISLEAYFLLSNGLIPSRRIRQFWIGLSPNFIIAALKVIFWGPNTKPNYKVTRKVNIYSNYVGLVFPQIIILALISLSLIKLIVSTPLYSGLDWAEVFWGLYQASFFIQIIRVSWWKYRPKLDISLLTKDLPLRNSHGTIYPANYYFNLEHGNNY